MTLPAAAGPIGIFDSGYGGLTILDGFYGRVLGDILRIIGEQVLLADAVLHQGLNDIVKRTASIDPG